MTEVRSVRFGHVSDRLRRELGAPMAERLLKQVGRFRGAQPPATVAQEAALIRAASLESGDAAIGARLGMAYRDAPTLAAYVAASSATLLEAVTCAARFYQLADPTTEFVVARAAGSDRLSVSSTKAGLQSNGRYMEFLVFGALSRVQRISDRAIRPTSVMFAHRSAGDARSFEQIAGCAVRFDAEFTGLAFANGAFDLRLRGHDPALVAHLTELAETQVQARQRVGDDDLRGIVEHRLVAALPERFLTADDVAGGLGMTRRTLSRRLRAQGTSFRGLCNALRYRLAKAYLQEGRSVTETAFLLGYGEQATFSAAFRGWSGQSPTEFAASA